MGFVVGWPLGCEGEVGLPCLSPCEVDRLLFLLLGVRGNLSGNGGGYSYLPDACDRFPGPKESF